MQISAPPAMPAPDNARVSLPLPGPDTLPRSVAMKLGMPIWDATLPPEAKEVDDQLGQLFRIEGIRSAGDFDRAALHRIAVGWSARFEALEGLRGAILAVAPHRGSDLTEAVRVGQAQLRVLQDADRPDATRAQLATAERALYEARNAMAPLRWGVPADVREEHWIRPGDIARSRMRQFDADRDERITSTELEHARLATEEVYGDPRTYRQRFSAHRLVALADQPRDGVATLAELETALMRWDGDGDGWLTRREFEDFERRADAQLVDMKVVIPRATA